MQQTYSGTSDLCGISFRIFAYVFFYNFVYCVYRDKFVIRSMTSTSFTFNTFCFLRVIIIVYRKHRLVRLQLTHFLCFFSQLFHRSSQSVIGYFCYHFQINFLCSFYMFFCTCRLHVKLSFAFFGIAELLCHFFSCRMNLMTQF